MNELIRQRRFNFGRFAVTVLMPEPAAERISKSPLYRNLMRPTAIAARNTIRRRGKSVPKEGRLIPARVPKPSDIDAATIELIQRVAPIEWRQVIDVGGGVATPGVVDYRPHLEKLALPESLTGMRCLDATSRDGFFAFEFERRGAAEVVALDWEPFMDTPLAEPSAGVEGDPGAFAIAREILGASVKRIHGRPGDRDVDSLGSFDLIIATDLVGRVRNPQLMLEHLARLCSGTLFLVERIDPLLERYGVLCLAEFTGSHRFKGRWWLPNTNMLKTMALVAGLDPVDEVGRFEMWTAGEGITHHVVLRGHANSRPALKTFMLALGGEGRVVESAPAQATAERAVRLGSVELKVELPRGLADRVGPARRLWKRPAKQDTPPHPNPTGSSVNEHPDAGPTTARAQELRRRMEGIDWYHTIELGDGVITPGFVDHRAQVSSYRLPASLSGQRCLDVATFDGFWAFEMERRGAAEVVAIDVANGIDCDIPTFLLDEVSSWGDSPMGRGFRVAHEILGSRVRHEICNVYDLTPERFGQFDLIFLSDLLLHLRDPQLALERIASVCRGTAIVGDVYNAMLECVPNRNLTQYVLWLPGGYTWWQPSSSTLRQMMKVAGFHEVIEVGRLTLQTQGGPCAKVIYHGSVRGE